MNKEKYEQLKKELWYKRKEVGYTKKDIIFLRNEWLRLQLQKCEECGGENNLTVDHIIPVELLREFGIDPERELLEEDFKVLCLRCNHYKGHRLDFRDIRTKPLLLKYLQRI
jgi:5-methylcytosine-specific restriction endonuclease McrA